MKSVSFDEFGGPEVLRIVDRPQPTPQAGEVVVGVVASTVNPTDLMSLSGARAALMKDLPRPYTAGMDFAGHVIAVGDRVTHVLPGEAVVGVVSPRREQGGAHAQVICVPAASVAPVADETDLIAASTVPMNALTGMLCLEILGLDAGQSLLVTGGAGMLGSVSLELALLEGLEVAANVGEADRDFIGGLGVQHILPRDDGLEDAVRGTFPGGLDGVIDGALIGRTISHLVRTGGGIVSPRASYQIEDPRLKVSHVQVTSGVENSEKILRIGRLLGQGRLTPRVAAGGVFPYTDAAEAYAMALAGGYRGRVVITFAD